MSKIKKHPESFVWYPEQESQLDFDLQRHADLPEGDSTNGDQSKGSGENLVDFKDPETGQTIKIPKELQSVLGHVISHTRKKTESDYAPLTETIKQLEGENKELIGLKEQLEKMELDKMTAEQKAQANAKKVIDDALKREKTMSEERDSWKKRYTDSTIRSDIVTSFGDSKLCNPSQVAILFETEGKARIEEKVDNNGKPTGVYETRVTLSIEDEKGNITQEDGTPAELFPKWIKMERNSYLVQNELKPGGGTGKKVTLSTGEKVDLSQIKDPTARMNAYREVNKK